MTNYEVALYIISYIDGQYGVRKTKISTKKYKISWMNGCISV